MNPIEQLRDELARRFPDVRMEIDAPAEEAGLWQLDLRPGGRAPWIVVEWKPDLGFGVSTPDADDYGTKPDEVYPNAKAAYGRVTQLILGGGRTEPPAAVRLAELRRLRELSQTELAARAGIKQAAVARIEGRGDILLSTLRRVVSAMGGHLSIRVEFPDGTARELTGLALATLPGLDESASAASQPIASSTKPSMERTVATARAKKKPARGTATERGLPASDLGTVTGPTKAASKQTAK